MRRMALFTHPTLDQLHQLGLAGMARAFVDQLERSNGLSATRIAAIRTELTAAEKASGQNRRNTLTALATGLTNDPGSSDQRKVRMLADAVRDLANATR